MASLNFRVPVDIDVLAETLREVRALRECRALPGHIASELEEFVKYYRDDRSGAPGNWFDADFADGRIEVTPSPRLMALVANMRACAERSDA